MIGSRWTPGFAAAIGGCVVAAGLLAIGGGTVGARAADTSLAYQCGFTSGTRQVEVRIQATLPESVTVGRQIQPDKVTVTASVPGTALGSASVSGTAGLAVTTTQNGQPATSQWAGLVISPIQGQGQVQGGADVPLTAVPAGPVPATSTAAVGDVGFTVGDLTLNLGSTANGKPVACTPAAGQDARLATVHVVQATTAAPTVSAPKSPSPSPPPYDTCFVIPVPDPNPPDVGWTRACAVFTGYANVTKLGAAQPLNDSSVQPTLPVGVLFGTVGQGLVVKFKFVKPMVSRATFVAFGFMPVQADIELDQQGTGEMQVNGDSTDPNIQRVTGSLDVGIRISRLLLNGVPLNVGPQCRTESSIRIRLSDVPGEPIHDILNDPRKAIQGAPFAIPKFTGCVSDGEDLGPLLDGAVSGPGDRMKITLGRIVHADLKPPIPPVVIPSPLR